MTLLSRMSDRAQRLTTPRAVTRIILAIILVKAVLILGVLPEHRSSVSDSYGVGFADQYNVLANNIVAGYGYRFTPETAPTLTREPGYPLLLAGLFSLFAYTLLIAQAANLVLSAISAHLVSRLAKETWSTPWAVLVAPLIYLLHPGVIVAEMRGGVEITFVFMLLCFIMAVLKALRSGRPADYLMAGLVLGLTSLVRSTALLFPLFLPVYFFLLEPVRPALRTMALRLAILFGAAALVMSPWIARNYALTQKVVPTASVQGIAAHAGNYICKNWSAEKGFQTLDREAARERIALAEQMGYDFEDRYYLYFYDARDEVEFNSFLGRRVFSEYRSDPALLAKCMSRNAFNFWFSGKNRRSTMANLLVQAPLLLLALAGLVAGWSRGDRRLIGFFALLIVYTMSVYLPIHAQARYSVPLVPILSILAAWPVSRLLERGVQDP